MKYETLAIGGFLAIMFVAGCLMGYAYGHNPQNVSQVTVVAHNDQGPVEWATHTVAVHDGKTVSIMVEPALNVTSYELTFH